MPHWTRPELHVVPPLLGLLAALMGSALPAPAVAAEWELLPSIAGAGRTGANAASWNGSVYVIGGRPWAAGTDYQGAAHCLPYGSLTWSPCEPVRYTQSFPGVAVDGLGRLLVIGGYEVDVYYPGYFVLVEGDVYDPYAPPSEEIARRTFGTAYTAYATDAQGRVYALGGRNQAGNTVEWVERYDPYADAWTVLDPLPERRAYAAAVYDGAGHVLLIGGAIHDGVFYDEKAAVFSYDVAAEAWTTLAPQPAALMGQSAVLGADGRVYVMGGVAGTIYHSDATYILDPVSLQWTDGPRMHVPRSQAAAALRYDGTIVIAGGYHDCCGTNTVERLDTRAPTGVASPAAEPEPARSLRVVPNPAGAASEIEFLLPAVGEARFALFDAAGRRISEVREVRAGAGRHTLSWNALAAGETLLPAGVYWVRMETAGRSRATPVVLLGEDR